jgi:hypothetical protein
MELSQTIKSRKLIDINLFDGKLTYTGICLVATKKIVVLINYDLKKKMFDGFTVFRNENFDSYEIWKEREIKLNIDNATSFSEKYKFDKHKTFHSWFKELLDKKMVAFFTNNNLKSYYVGKIVGIDIKKIKVKLVDRKGSWTRTKTFNIADIDFFSFDTSLENKLDKKNSTK